jgi:hypothetical protein
MTEAVVERTSAMTTKSGSLCKSSNVNKILKLGALGTTARQKCFEVAHHVKVVEEFGGCVRSGGFEIRCALTKASEICRRTWRSRGCGLLFSGGANNGAIEQQKQVEG